VWAIDRAWSYQPERLWLHTCTEDHPKALPNYLKAGFKIFKEEIGDPLSARPSSGATNQS